MTSTKVLWPVLLLSIIVLISSCMEEPIMTDLIDELELLVGDTLLVNVNTLTYRIPPAMGSFSYLYFGTDSTYECPFSLVNMGFYSSDYEISFLTLDTTAVVSIDSLYFYLFYQDTLLPDNLYEYYITDIPLAAQGGVDSVFNEGSSNYTNLDMDMIHGRMQEPLASTTMVIDSIYTYPYLKFDITDSARRIISNFADTTEGTTNRTFILWRAEPEAGRQRFRSTEMSSYKPRMKITFQSDDSNEIDTLTYTFNGGTDVTVVIPPDISTIDTTTISIGTALGVRSIVYLDYDSTFLPPEALVRSARLILWKDDVSENDTSFTVGLYAIDTAEITSYNYVEYDEDPYDSQMELPDGTEDEGIVELETRILMQNVILDQYDNYGMKLYSTTANNPFTTYHFHNGASADSAKHPRLEVIYVMP